MVPMIGVGLWLLAGAAMGRAVRGTARACGAGRSACAVWFLLAAFAIVLLFRPHEDIFGGQDPGAYLNAACSFARHKTLFHTDPLLAQVNERLRAEFFYGHSGFGLTKDACLWVSDLKTARIGPWFLPAYAVMMSAVAWLVAPAAVLYVAPLLGLLTAATLAMLAARLIRRPWAGAAAFLLYVLNPVVIWNARAPRAEMGAGFFLMIGWVLIFDAWDRARRRGGLDLTLGAICLGVAPFFHATAWHPVLASFAVLCWIAVAGRLDFLPVVPVAVLTVAGFIAQTRFVTDCYAIWRFAEPLLRHPAAIGAAGCLGTVAVVVASRWSETRIARRAPSPGAGSGAVDVASRPLALAGRLLALLPVVLFVAVYLKRAANGQIPFLPQLPPSLFTLTDFRGLVRLTSPVAALGALAGWVWLTWRREEVLPWKRRLTFLLAMLPGLLLTGWMNDYMMETRRLMIVPAPVMSLCLSAIVVAGAGCFGSRSAALSGVGVALLIGSLAWRKTALYVETDYRGFYRCVESIAAEVRRCDGMLLCEYSRTAAPFEHFFGIPLLALDSDRRSDYRKAEREWSRIMAEAPRRAVFFLSPYAHPVSELFEFVLVKEVAWTGSRLPSGRRAVPRSARSAGMTLHLYRMTPRGSEASLFDKPFVRTLDGGNMGVRRFAKVISSGKVSGVPLPSGRDVAVVWTTRQGGGQARDALLYLHGGTSAAPPALAVLAGQSPAPRWLHLVDRWWLAEISPVDGTATSVVLRAAEPGVLLGNMEARTGTTTCPVPLSAAMGRVTNDVTPFASRWSRAGSELLLPAPAGRNATAYLLLRLEEKQPAAGYELTTDRGYRQALELGPGRWEWRAVSIPPGFSATNTVSLRFLADPPWDPGLRGFPDNLAVLVGCAVVEPGDDHARGERER